MRPINILLIGSLLCFFSLLFLFSSNEIIYAREDLSIMSEEKSEDKIKIGLEEQSKKIGKIIEQRRNGQLLQELKTQQEALIEKKKRLAAREVRKINQTKILPPIIETVNTTTLIIVSILIVALGLIFIFWKVYQVKTK